MKISVYKWKAKQNVSFLSVDVFFKTVIHIIHLAAMEGGGGVIQPMDNNKNALWSVQAQLSLIFSSKKNKNKKRIELPIC